MEAIPGGLGLISGHPDIPNLSTRLEECQHLRGCQLKGREREREGGGEGGREGVRERERERLSLQRNAEK